MPEVDDKSSVPGGFPGKRPGYDLVGGAGQYCQPHGHGLYINIKGQQHLEKI